MWSLIDLHGSDGRPAQPGEANVHMNTQEVRSNLGTRTLGMMSQRDWPEGVVQTGHEENEIWLYEDGRPARKLDIVEAWNILHHGGNS
jgi:hypothetical protein